MHFLISLKKAYTNFHHLVMIRMATLILLSFVAFSCGNNESGKLNGDTGGRVAGAARDNRLARGDSMSVKMYRLYLVNTLAKPELKNLLTNGRGHEKLLFQFTHIDSGFLVLRAWSAKSGNKDFVLGNQILLRRNYPIIVDTTLNGQIVDLGDIELDREAFRALSNKINTSQHNDPNFNYISFIPRIVSDERVQQGGNANYKHIVYQIVGSSSLDKVAFAPTPITDANPSPPREAY